MKEILILECIYGYEFKLRDGQITYLHVEGSIPDEQTVLSLFRNIKAKRDQAVEYLQCRFKPVNVAEHLWQSAEKALLAASHAEQLGNDQLAQREWQRAKKLFARSLEAFGVTEPNVPWNDWVAWSPSITPSPSGDRL